MGEETENVETKNEYNKSDNEEEAEEDTELTKDTLNVPNGQNGYAETKFVDEEEVERCGLGSFNPEWIQRFASKKSFMIVFSMLAVIQGMGWAYFSATITTLEKRFKISLQTAGLVMTGNELSQILFSIILAYYGGRGHRPRWMASGVMFSALACLLLASPHLFYGPGTDSLMLTEEYAHLDSDNQMENAAIIAATTSKYSNFGIEMGDEETISSTISSSILDAIKEVPKANGTGSRRSRIQLCKKGPAPSKGPNDCHTGDTSIVPLILIFISQFVSGIGVLLFFSLGGPYLDDNIKKTKSPMMFGITMSLRLIGPTLGFLFAGACLKIYISPSLTPLITVADPRWLGAWWLGWVVLGALMALTAMLISLFPKELPRAIKRKKDKDNKNVGSQLSLARNDSKLVLTAEKTAENPFPKLSEMPKAVKALITNKVNLFNNLAAVFYFFSAIGYMEVIFMQTAVNASVVSGIISIAFQSIGLLVSGALISKFQPTARKLAAWNVLLGFLYVAVKITFTQLSCDPGETAFGIQDQSTGVWNLTSDCNIDCNCKVNKILPVCYKDANQVFYSACHAGCTTFVNNNTLSGCSCLPSPDDQVVLGTCNEGCFKTFMTFLAINAVIKLLDSSGRIGNMLVSYRCVHPKDKSLAIGLAIFLISILAMLPAPILFGAIIAFTFVGAFFDCLVWYYVGDLDLYDEDYNVEQRRKRAEEARTKEMQTIQQRA